MNNIFNIKKDSLFMASTFYLVAVSLLPVFRYMISESWYYALTAISYTIVVFYSLLHDAKEMLLYFTIVLLFSVLYYFGSSHYTYSFLTSLRGTIGFWIFIPIALYCKGLDKTNKIILLSFICLCIVVTAITTIIGLRTHPSAARYLSSYKGEVTDYYSSLNIGGYCFIYSCTILLPILLTIVKTVKRKIIRLLIWVMICLLLSLAISSQYTISVLISICSILFFFLFRGKKHFLFSFIVCSIFLLGLLFLYFSPESLTAYSANLKAKGFDIFSNRIDEIIKFFSKNDADGDLEARLDRYFLSIATFFKSPVFGAVITSDRVGGHATLLDLLGSAGLFGLTVFIYLLNVGFDKEQLTCRFVSSPSKIGFLFFIILGLINTVLFDQIAIILFVFCNLCPSIVNGNR